MSELLSRASFETAIGNFRVEGEGRLAAPVLKMEKMKDLGELGIGAKYLFGDKDIFSVNVNFGYERRSTQEYSEVSKELSGEFGWSRRLFVAEEDKAAWLKSALVLGGGPNREEELDDDFYVRTDVDAYRVGWLEEYRFDSMSLKSLLFLETSADDLFDPDRLTFRLKWTDKFKPKHLGFLGSGLAVVGVDRVVASVDNRVAVDLEDASLRDRLIISAELLWYVKDDLSFGVGGVLSANSKKDSWENLYYLDLNVTIIEGFEVGFQLFYGNPYDMNMGRY